MPTPRPDRIPLNPDRSRRWTALTRNERVVLAALYRRPTGATLAELRVACALSERQLTDLLDGLSNGCRCGPLGAVAVGRVAPAAGDPPEVRYAVTRAWCEAHRTGIDPRDALAARPDGTLSAA